MKKEALQGELPDISKLLETDVQETTVDDAEVEAAIQQLEATGQELMQVKQSFIKHVEDMISLEEEGISLLEATIEMLNAPEGETEEDLVSSLSAETGMPEEEIKKLLEEVKNQLPEAEVLAKMLEKISFDYSDIFEELDGGEDIGIAKEASRFILNKKLN